MRITDITIDALHSQSRIAPQYRPIDPARPADTVFRADSLTIGNIASPYETYSAEKPATSKNEPWCISNCYPMSQYEVLPKIREVRQEIGNADFKGMSDFEIYDWIENKYAEAFGKDFMMAYNLGVSDPIDQPSSETTGFNFVGIGSSFLGALHKQFGDAASGLRPAYPEINRARLYGDMSDTEIKDAIRAKYPPNAHMTNRDLQLMSGELSSVGLISSRVPIGFFATTFDSNGQMIDILDGYGQGRLMAKILDEPVDFSLIFGLLNNYTRLGRNEPFETELRDFYVKYLGATIGPDGLLYPDYFSSRRLNTGNIELPDLEEEFLKTLEKHEQRLNESKDQYNPESEGVNSSQMETDKNNISVSKKTMAASNPH